LRDFSRGQGYSDRALRYWVERLREHGLAGDEPGPRDVQRLKGTGRSVRLAKVFPREGTPDSMTGGGPGASLGTITVVVGTVKVLVEAGFDTGTLSRLVDVLESHARRKGGLR
jgi:hypothetical protein